MVTTLKIYLYSRDAASQDDKFDEKKNEFWIYVYPLDFEYAILERLGTSKESPCVLSLLGPALSTMQSCQNK